MCLQIFGPLELQPLVRSPQIYFTNLLLRGGRNKHVPRQFPHNRP